MRDHAFAVLAWFIAGAASFYFMRGLAVPPDGITYVELLYGAAFWVPLAVDYVRRRNWWKTTLLLLDQMENAYQLPATLEEAAFSDAELASEIIERMAQDMGNEVARHEKARRDYRDYLERWIHEVKTPIASAKLTAHNHRGGAMDQVAKDLDRIEARVMQALYYARSSAVEKDYLIEKTTLGTLVDAALRRNSRELIAAHFTIDRADLDDVVYTDPKWIGFVLDQVIQNAVKYRKGDSGVLRFRANEGASSCELIIEDEGVGVSAQDIGRIFEKGFTGQTGRRYAASTGMGLYISTQLLTKMNHSMRAESTAEHGGLTLIIHFPRDTMHTLAG